MLDGEWQLRLPLTAYAAPDYGLLTSPTDGSRCLDCSSEDGPKFDVNGDRIDVLVSVTTDDHLNGLKLTYVRTAYDGTLDIFCVLRLLA